jgi:hypothetical protein
MRSAQLSLLERHNGWLLRHGWTNIAHLAGLDTSAVFADLLM